MVEGSWWTAPLVPGWEREAVDEDGTRHGKRTSIRMVLQSSFTKEKYMDLSDL